MKWQPIESAPRDGEMVLLGVGGISDATTSGWWTGDDWWVPDGHGWYEYTHWMPLPEPPR